MKDQTPSSGRDKSDRAPGHLLAFVVLFAVPLFLRLWPIEHGLPENYLADTHVVKNALGMARDKNPVPPSGLYSTYPYLLPYLLLPVYAGEYAGGRVTGAWTGSGEFKQQVLENPTLVHLPARILLALLCALTPLIVYRGARAAGLTRGAWVAAWLVSTGLLHLHFSVQERPWGPLVFFMALTALFVIRHAKSHATRDLVYSGLAAGLAFATHQAGILALGMSGLGWLFAALDRRELLTRKRLFMGAKCVAAALLVALLLGYPFYLVHGSPETNSFDSAPEISIGVGGQGILFELRWASVVRLSRALFGYDPAIVLLSLIGLIAALARRETRAVTVFALAWLAFFLSNQNDHIRYLLPAAVLLVYPAGVAAELLLSRRFGVLLLAPLLLFPLVQATRLAWVLRQPDSRVLAREAIEALPDDARIAIDRYGPSVPGNEASLRRLAEWRALGSREMHRLAYLEVGVTPPSGPGRDLVRLEDLYEFSDRFRAYKLKPAVLEQLAREAGEASAALAASSTPDCLELLGITHILLVDRRPLDGVPPAVLDPEPPLDEERTKPLPLISTGAGATVIDPSVGPGQAAETLLPTDMDFPLTAIWQVERPGPYMELRGLER